MKASGILIQNIITSAITFMIGTLFGSFKNRMRPIKLRLAILLVSCFMIASAGIAGTIYAVNTAPGRVINQI